MISVRKPNMNTRHNNNNNNDVNSDDITFMMHRGHEWGKAISLPANDENLAAIQHGPYALADAADYYDLCKNDKERSKVLFWFEEGVRQHTNTAGMDFADLFTAILNNRTPNRTPNPTQS